MNKKHYLIIFALVIVFGLISFYLGYQKNIKDLEKYKKLTDLAFPPPPAIINSLNGTIKNIYGATIVLEINSPQDYLPKLNNEPRLKETRYAIVNSKTQIDLVKVNEFDEKGNNIIQPLKFEDLKVGDSINVFSDENLKNLKKFEVKRIVVYQE